MEVFEKHNNEMIESDNVKLSLSLIDSDLVLRIVESKNEQDH